MDRTPRSHRNNAYRRYGHVINIIAIVVCAVFTYVIITTGINSKDGGACEFFVAAYWRALILDFLLFQPAALFLTVGYRWTISDAHEIICELHP